MMFKGVFNMVNMRNFLDYQGRPLNLGDYMLIRYGDGSPENDHAWVGAVISRFPFYAQKARELMDSGEIQKFVDLSLPQSLRYALRSPGLVDFYTDRGFNDGTQFSKKEYLGILESEEPRVLLNLLPAGNNQILRDYSPSGGMPGESFWIPGTVIRHRDPSGGTTGNPVFRGRTIVDEYNTVLAVAVFFSVLGMEGQSLLNLVPLSHIWSRVSAKAAELLGATPRSPHYRHSTTEDILEQMESERIGMLLTAPFGPKGSTGDLETLIRVDDQGRGVLEKYPTTRKVVTGGAPIVLESEVDGQPIDGVGLQASDLDLEHWNMYGSALTGMMGGRRLRDTDLEVRDGMRYTSPARLIPGELIYELIPTGDDRFDDAEFEEMLTTTLGAEGHPLVRFGLGDRMRRTGGEHIGDEEVEWVCRKEWMTDDGKVVIPRGVGTCVSDV